MKTRDESINIYDTRDYNYDLGHEDQSISQWTLFLERLLILTCGN